MHSGYSPKPISSYLINNRQAYQSRACWCVGPRRMKDSIRTTNWSFPSSISMKNGTWTYTKIPSGKGTTNSHRLYNDNKQEMHSRLNNVWLNEQRVSAEESTMSLKKLQHTLYIYNDVPVGCWRFRSLMYRKKWNALRAKSHRKKGLEKFYGFSWSYQNRKFLPKWNFTCQHMLNFYKKLDVKSSDYLWKRISRI